MSAAQPSADAAAVACAPFQQPPRLFRVAATDESDEGKQGTAHVSPVERLYRHAIESVFGFLNLADLSRALAVSRSWAAAVRSMKSIGAEVTSAHVLPWMVAASALAAHVKHFGSLCDSRKTGSNALLLLSRPPISLVSLTCTVDLTKQPSRLFLGDSLQSLVLNLEGPADTVSAINDAIVTISRSPTLTELHLCLPSFFPDLSFAPFAVAPRLRTFCCEALDRNQPSHAQLDQLRMLVHLYTMHIRNLSRDSLLYLLRTPHALQWQEIRGVTKINDGVSAALSHLPTLTQFSTSQCRSVAFLSSLTRLRSLWLTMDFAVRVAAEIAAGLSCCTQLMELTLEAADLTSELLSQALSPLPALRSLWLSDCFALNSLSFLSECIHLSHSLQTLELWGPDPGVVPSTDLKHVLTLRSLTHLLVRGFFVEPLDAPMVQTLTPPSLVLPQLREFDYSS